VSGRGECVRVNLYRISIDVKVDTQGHGCILTRMLPILDSTY
jgi:hypothetical protein